MSKLEFFCNRPTLVALIDFGFDLSSGNNTVPSKDLPKDPNESSVIKEKTEELGQTHVKGLLGHGKTRVVFVLNMNVNSVTVFLNKEDGSQLAMFVQESFLLDIKVGHLHDIKFILLFISIDFLLVIHRHFCWIQTHVIPALEFVPFYCLDILLLYLTRFIQVLPP